MSTITQQSIIEQAIEQWPEIGMGGSNPYMWARNVIDKAIIGAFEFPALEKEKAFLEICHQYVSALKAAEMAATWPGSAADGDEDAIEMIEQYDEQMRELRTKIAELDK